MKIAHIRRSDGDDNLYEVVITPNILEKILGFKDRTFVVKFIGRSLLHDRNIYITETGDLIYEDWIAEKLDNWRKAF